MQAAGWTSIKPQSSLQAEIKVWGFKSFFARSCRFKEKKKNLPDSPDGVGQHEEMRVWMLLSDKQE